MSDRGAPAPRRNKRVLPLICRSRRNPGIVVRPRSLHARPFRLGPAWAAGAMLLLSACAGGADYSASPQGMQPQPGSSAGAPPPSVAALPSPAAPVNPPSDVQQLVG